MFVGQQRDQVGHAVPTVGGARRAPRVGRDAERARLDQMQGDAREDRLRAARAKAS